MIKTIVMTGTAIAILVLPSIAVAKTVIPYWYNCNYNQKEGNLWCATTCVNTRTGQLVHISPAACRPTPSTHSG
jgi:hypothetical protein